MSRPSGRLCEPVERTHGLEGGIDVGVGGVAPADPHVVADRAGEQEPLLGHDAHVRAQLGVGDVTQVDATDADDAIGRVVETGHELGDRRLAGAGGPDDGEPLARLDAQRDVVEHQRAVVRSGTTRATSSTAPPVGRGTGIAGSSDVGIGVDQVEELVEPRAGRLDHVEELAELVERLEQVRQGEHEEGDGPEGHVAVVRRATRRPARVAAVVSTPAPSITGRYHAEMRTESMWAS